MSKHMTEDDRAMILQGIMQKKTFVDIGALIGKAPSTITREVLKHRVAARVGAVGRPCNDCKLKAGCPKSKECDNKGCKRLTCSNCASFCCTESCTSYVKEACPRLQGVPYVCDGCTKRGSCSLEKMLYKPASAHNEYRKVLSSSRSGHRASAEELATMNNVLHYGTAKGQSINHIYSYAGGQMPYSQRTAYNLINDNCLDDVIRLDQPRAVAYRKRANKGTGRNADSHDYLKGRLLGDYYEFLERNPGASVVQMDCVEGSHGGNGRVLLTLHFVASDLQLAYILEEKTTEAVAACHRAIREKIGRELYKKLFAAILTDRGSEFKDPESIEETDDGEIVANVFYCEAMRSDQKGACERNHAEIRRILRKGQDITCQQHEIDLMMNHINSYSRPQFLNRSALDTFILFYGIHAAEALGLTAISPELINLKPSLLN